MNIKLSPYYHKHLFNRLTPNNKKRIKKLNLDTTRGISIDLNTYIDFAECCSQIEQDPLFSLRTAAKSLPLAHGLLGLLVQSCNTLGEACLHGFKFQHLTRNALHSTMSYESSTVTSRIDIGVNDPQYISVLIEYCQASFYGVANALCDPSRTIAIKEIHFMHRPRAPLAEYKKILKADHILFSQNENKIIFSREIMDYPIEGSDSGANQVLLVEAKSQLLSVHAEQSFISRVQELLTSADSFNNLSQSQCAQSLKMSESTLKRRLIEEGTSYKPIFDDVREGYAKRLLADISLSIQEISVKLHFSNRSAFARSFRHRTGQSPLQYRQSVS